MVFINKLIKIGKKVLVLIRNWISENKKGLIILITLLILILICIGFIFIAHKFVYNSSTATYWNTCGVLFQAFFAFIGILSTIAMLFITWNLSKRQLELSQSQNKIAERQEQLSITQNNIAEEQKNMTKRQINLELYSKRYEIYEASINFLDKIQKNIEFPCNSSFIITERGTYKLKDNSIKIKVLNELKKLNDEYDYQTREKEFLLDGKLLNELISISSQYKISIECLLSETTFTPESRKGEFLNIKIDIDSKKTSVINMFTEYLNFKNI